MRLKSDGFTLIELLVSMTVMAIMLTLLAAIFVPALRSWTRSDRRSQAQQAVLVVASRLREEVRDASPDAIVCVSNLLPGPVHHDSVSLVSWDTPSGTMPFDRTGDVLWQKRVVVYLQWGEVRVQESALTPTTDVTSVTLPTFMAAAGDRVVARNISSLAFSQPASGVLQVDVQAQVDGQISELHTTVVATQSLGANPSPSPSP